MIKENPNPTIRSIINRSELLKLEGIAEIFCYEKDTLLRKWHTGEPIIRELQFKTLGKTYVADERRVWKILERFKASLEVAVPRWRDKLQRDLSG